MRNISLTASDDVAHNGPCRMVLGKAPDTRM